MAAGRGVNAFLGSLKTGYVKYELVSSLEKSDFLRRTWRRPTSSWSSSRWRPTSAAADLGQVAADVGDGMHAAAVLRKPHQGN